MLNLVQSDKHIRKDSSRNRSVISFPRSDRRSLVQHLCVSLIAVVFALAAPMVASAKTKSNHIEWLVIESSNEDHWRHHINSNEPSRLYVSPKDKRADEIDHRILVLVAKKSGSYKLAMNRLLKVFNDERFLAAFEVVNLNRDEVEGKKLLNEAKSQGFDMVFTMGSEAAAMAHKFYHNGPLPVVTSINKDPVTLGQVPSYKEGTGNNIATTSLNVPIDIQLNYLLELNPKLENVLLLYNNTHKQVVKTEVIPFRQTMQKNNINVIDVTVDSRDNAREQLPVSLSKAVKQLETLDPSLDKSLIWLTSSTAIFSNVDLVREHSSVIPVVSTNPNAVREGADSAAVAIGIDRRNNAHLAAIYALRILRDGVDPGSLEVGVVTPPDIALNFKVAREIGLKVPFTFLEGAHFVYGYHGETVRSFGQNVHQ
jgi:putative ABC transport system substrate-binding protein